MHGMKCSLENNKETFFTLFLSFLYNIFENIFDINNIKSLSITCKTFHEILLKQFGEAMFLKSAIFSICSRFCSLDTKLIPHVEPMLKNLSNFSIINETTKCLISKIRLPVGSRLSVDFFSDASYLYGFIASMLSHVSIGQTYCVMKTGFNVDLTIYIKYLDINRGLLYIGIVEDTYTRKNGLEFSDVALKLVNAEKDVLVVLQYIDNHLVQKIGNFKKTRIGSTNGQIIIDDIVIKCEDFKCDELRTYILSKTPFNIGSYNFEVNGTNSYTQMKPILQNRSEKIVPIGNIDDFPKLQECLKRKNDTVGILFKHGQDFACLFCITNCAATQQYPQNTWKELVSIFPTCTCNCDEKPNKKQRLG